MGIRKRKWAMLGTGEGKGRSTRILKRRPWKSSYSRNLARLSPIIYQCRRRVSKHIDLAGPGDPRADGDVAREFSVKLAAISERSTLVSSGECHTMMQWGFISSVTPSPLSPSARISSSLARGT